MAKREIGTSLKLDGEAQFKTAITNINQELRVLSSEMGAAVSSFDKSGASISDLKAKGDIYEKQLESQKEKLSVLQNAVEAARETQAKAAQTAAEMAEKYGANSDEAKKASEAVAAVTKKLNDYQIQANNTTKNINQLEAAQRSNNEQIEKLQKVRLERLTEEFKKLASEAGKAAAETAKIAAKTLTAGIDAGVKALTAYTGAVTGAATAVYGLSAKSAAMADDINTLTKTTGISTEQLQIMSLYSNQVDVSLETTAKALQKLTVNMGDAAEGSSSAVAKFEALGLSVTDATGNLRSNDEVFAEAIAKLGEIENETERDAIAMDLFGKSAQDLNPLILGGADALKEFGESAKKNGLILSQEALDSLNEFNDSIDNLKTNTSAAGNILAGVFAPQFQIFTDIIGNNAAGIITSISDIFSGKAIDGEALMEQLNDAGGQISENIGNLLPAFLDGFNTVGLSFVQSAADTLPQAVETLLPVMINGFTSLVSGLVQKIPSFVPTVLKGAVTLFKGILDGLNQVIARITPMLPQIVSDISGTLVENIPALISGAAQFFAGIVSAIAEVIPSIIAAVVEIVPLICSSIIENIPLLIKAGLQLFVSLTESLPDAIVQIVATLPEIINGIISALLEAVPQIIQTGIDLFVALIEALPEIITTIVEALPQIITGIITALAAALPQLVQAGFDLFIGLIGALPDIIIALVNAIPQITEGLVTAFIGAAPEFTEAGVELFTAVVTNLPQIITEIVKAVPKIVNGIVDGFKENMGNITNIGKEIMAGIGDGIISGVNAVKDKINAAGEKIMNSFKDFFGIHSPSTKMKEEVGYNLADGTAEGFIEQMKRNTANMNAAVPQNYTIGVNVTDEKTAKKAIDSIVTDYKKGRLSQRQADALTVSVYRDCEQKKIDITEYVYEKINAARKDAADKNQEQLEKNLKAEITAYEKQIGEIQKSIQKTADNLTESYKSMYTFEKDEDGNIISAKTTNKIRNATKELDDFNAEVEKLMERGVSGGLLIQLDGMSREEGAAVAEYWNTLSDKELKALEKNWEKYRASANKLSERLHAEETENAARDMLENLNGVIADSSAELDNMGLQIMAGLREGMTGNAAGKQIKEVCDSIISRFKEYFGIASPSKVMKKEIGLNLADGVGVGFTEQMSKISADMQKSVPTHFDLDVEVDTAATARRRYGAAGGNNSGGLNFTQIINSPKALDTATVNRQTRQSLQLAAIMK